MSDNKIPGLPEIKVNKNGYEIRSDILGLAEKLVIEEYKAKQVIPNNKTQHELIINMYNDIVHMYETDDKQDTEVAKAVNNYKRGITDITKSYYLYKTNYNSPTNDEERKKSISMYKRATTKFLITKHKLYNLYKSIDIEAEKALIAANNLEGIVTVKLSYRY